MVLKNSYTKRRIDETILDNRILIVWVACQGTNCTSSGCLTLLRDILATVKASCEVVPETVTELVKLYAEIEPSLQAVDAVEVFSDQESASSRIDELHEWGNNSQSPSLEQFQAYALANLVYHLYRELPEKVDYLD